MATFACRPLLAGFVIGLLFGPEEEANTFLRNVTSVDFYQITRRYISSGQNKLQNKKS
jgi:hypothetical protein